MNHNSIDIELLIIIPISFIVMLIMVSAFQTLMNLSQVTKIRQVIFNENLETLKTTKAYYFATGLKKGYPSYPSVFNLSANSEEIFVYGYSRFPFIFKTYYPAFILSTNITKSKTKVDLNRIFILESLSVKNNRHLNIQFVDTITIPTSVDYQIDFGDQLTEKTLNNLKFIEQKIITGANNVYDS